MPVNEPSYVHVLIWQSIRESPSRKLGEKASEWITDVHGSRITFKVTFFGLRTFLRNGTRTVYATPKSKATWECLVIKRERNTQYNAGKPTTTALLTCAAWLHAGRRSYPGSRRSRVREEWAGANHQHQRKCQHPKESL
jgi:hypothetical protein